MKLCEEPSGNVRELRARGVPRIRRSEAFAVFQYSRENECIRHAAAPSKGLPPVLHQLCWQLGRGFSNRWSGGIALISLAAAYHRRPPFCDRQRQSAFAL